MTVTWALSARPLPVTAALTSLGVCSATGRPRARRADDGHRAGLGGAHHGAHVVLAEHPLDRDRVGPVLAQPALDLLLQGEQPGADVGARVGARPRRRRPASARTRACRPPRRARTGSGRGRPRARASTRCPSHHRHPARDMVTRPIASRRAGPGCTRRPANMCSAARLRAAGGRRRTRAACRPAPGRRHDRPGAAQNRSSMNGGRGERAVEQRITRRVPPAASPARRSVATGVPAYSAARPRAPSVSGPRRSATAPAGPGSARACRGRRAVPAQRAAAVADLQPPPPGVGRPGGVGDPQRHGRRTAGGKPRAATAAGRVHHPQHPVVMVHGPATRLAGQPPHRVGGPDPGADGSAIPAVRATMPHSARVVTRRRGHGEPHEDLVVPVAPGVAGAGRRRPGSRRAGPRRRARAAASAASRYSARVARRGVHAAEHVERLGGIVRPAGRPRLRPGAASARRPRPAAGTGSRAAPSAQRPRGPQRRRASERSACAGMTASCEVPASPSPATGRSAALTGRAPTAGSRGRAISSSSAGHQRAADAPAPLLRRDRDARHPGHRHGAAVPPLPHVVEPGRGDEPRAVERAQVPPGRDATARAPACQLARPSAAAGPNARRRRSSSARVPSPGSSSRIVTAPAGGREARTASAELLHDFVGHRSSRRRSARRRSPRARRSAGTPCGRAPRPAGPASSAGTRPRPTRSRCPASCSAVRTADQVGRLADHLERLAEVVDLLGAGVEHRRQHVVLGQPVVASLRTMTTPLRLNR